jgi:hypothetical protein
MKLIYLLSLITIINLMNCIDTEWTDPATQTYYNFSSLKRDFNNPWTIERRSAVYSLVYSFNIGLALSNLCNGQQSNVIEAIEVQVAQGQPAICRSHGNMDNIEVKLINPNNPAEGIVLTYTRGDSCELVPGTQFKTNFHLFCSEVEDTEVNIIPLISVQVHRAVLRSMCA